MLRIRYVTFGGILCFLLCSVSINSQVFGVVKDENTNAPIEFANVFIEDSPIGVMANEKGGFRLIIPPEHLGKSIIFSCMGYIPDTIVQPYPTNPLKISLVKNNIFLSEINIKPINPLNLLSEALQRVPQNYLCKTSHLDAYYREVVKTDSAFVKYSDAACVIEYCGYETKYNQELASSVFFHLDYSKWIGISPFPQAKLTVPHQCDAVNIVQLRKSNNLESFINQWGFEESIKKFDIGGGPLHITAADIVKLKTEILDSTTWKHYNFKYKGQVIDKNSILHKITFSPKVNNESCIWQGSVYIDKDCLAFVRIEMEIPESHKKDIKASVEQIVELKRKEKKKLKKYSVKRQTQSTGQKVRVDYSKLQDKWYLSFIQIENKYKNLGDAFNEINYQTNIELYVNNVHIKDVIPLKTDALFYTNKYNFLFQNPSFYTPEFWNNYNVALPNEVFSKALKEIGKNNSMNSQFLENSK